MIQVQRFNKVLKLSLIHIYYKKYKCPDVCAELLEKGHYHYFGPSKASLSICLLYTSPLPTSTPLPPPSNGATHRQPAAICK